MVFVIYFLFIITRTNMGSSLPIYVGMCISMKALHHSAPTDKHGIGVFGRTKSYDVSSRKHNNTETSTNILQSIHHHYPILMGRTHTGRGAG